MSERTQQQAGHLQRQPNSEMPAQQQVVVVGQAKDMALAYVLWLFLGGFGAHRFYLERTGSGVAILILGLIGWATVWFVVGIVPLAIWGIWLIVDLFLIPGMVREANQRLGIVTDTTAAAIGSYAPKDAYDELPREKEEQQRQVTSAPATPTADYPPHETLAAVKETVALSPKEVLDEAESFLTGSGYTHMHRVNDSLGAERQLQVSEEGRRTAFLTVAATPQPGGGVQVSVSGDDREGVLKHQDAWTEWSENLPKQAEAEANIDELGNPGEQHTEETTDVPQQPPATTGTFHFCSNCGHKAQAGEKFCSECGHKLHA